METSASQTLSVQKVFPPAHVVIATVLGGVMAGAILMSLNYRRTGDIRTARCWLTGTLLFPVLLVVLALLEVKMLDFGTMGFLFFTMIMYYIAKTVMPVRRITETDGLVKASPWMAAGTGLACLGVQVAVLFGLGYLAEDLLA
jgi:hypothetical protein